MTTYIPKTAMSLTLLLALAACGGSGGGDPISGGPGGTTNGPDASDGYAEAGDEIDQGITFSTTGNSKLVRVGGTPSVQQSDITVAFTNPSGANPGVVTLQVDGQSLNAVLSSGSQTDYFGQNNVNGVPTNVDFDVLETVPSNIAAQARLSIVPSGSSTDSQVTHIVYGFDTDPATIAALSPPGGSIFYDAEVNVDAVQGTTTARGSGFISLEADFVNDTIDGSMNLGSLTGIMNGQSYDLQSTAISGNGFSGNIAVDGSLPTGLDLQSGAYAGQFYGVDALVIGGNVLLTITEDGSDPISIQGAFLGTED
ncbi:transferrin-binding protein-like solute binding protein [Yoonia sp. SDW83-1]|uniref:transferrin-binding protein-like solute binding protein n=1 Tax=Yoonia sp. SDW83-1 TaxID=3366945 RepID=UPI00398C5D5D